MTPPLRNFPLGIRLVLIAVIFCFNYFFFPVVGALLTLPFLGMAKIEAVFAGNFGGITDKYVFLFVQGIASLGTFAFTSLLISQLETGFVVKRMALAVKPALKLLVVAVIAVLVSQAFIQLLVDLNQKIPLPHALKFLVEQGKQQEAIENSLLEGTSVFMFLANALVLALIPAIGEEFFFRGIVLGDLLKSKINPVVSILATGLLFSMAHVQPDNFLAIWVLGSFLGFLYYISGSIWLSVAAHFVNNFLVVLLKYIYNAGIIKTNIAEAEIPLYAGLISLVLFTGCVLILNKWRRPIDFNSELDETDVINEEEHYI